VPGEATLTTMKQLPSYGFVGAGEIAAAIVTGLATGVDEPPTIFLSPRGRAVASELASRFPTVHVCADNQEVLDRAAVVLVAVRPNVAAEVLAQLRFHPQHVVLSALAGVRLDKLRAWTAPAGVVVRTIPLPTAAHAASLTAMFPDHAVARELFGRVGGVLVPADEPALDAFSAATATFAAHLDYLATIATWLTDHGVDSDAATGYVRHVFGQLGQTLLRHNGSLDALAERHMTPGGINLQLRTDLRDAGTPEVLRRALDGVLARLTS